MNALLNIPPHTGCKKCGDCCGVIPATGSEIAAIRKYISDKPTIKKLAEKQSNDMLNCPFLDKEQNQCIIYPKRPMICRLMGVDKYCKCKYGNSASINGMLFMKDLDYDSTELLNHISWD